MILLIVSVSSSVSKCMVSQAALGNEGVDIAQPCGALEAEGPLDQSAMVAW